MDNHFQRIGSISNSAVGRDFEEIARAYFSSRAIELSDGFAVPIGVGSEKKERRFDLGSTTPPILVECKSHRWTTGGNVPSAKITVWNEAMYFFQLAPERFRKVLFVLRDYSESRGETLAEYYQRTHSHLVPNGVEILEFDPKERVVREVRSPSRL